MFKSRSLVKQTSKEKPFYPSTAEIPLGLKRAVHSSLTKPWA